MGDIDPSLLLQPPNGLAIAPLKQYAQQPTRALSAPPPVDDIDSLFCELNHAMDKSSRLVPRPAFLQSPPTPKPTPTQAPSIAMLQTLRL